MQYIAVFYSVSSFFLVYIKADTGRMQNGFSIVSQLSDSILHVNQWLRMQDILTFSHIHTHSHILTTLSHTLTYTLTLMHSIHTHSHSHTHIAAGEGKREHGDMADSCGRVHGHLPQEADQG